MKLVAAPVVCVLLAFPPAAAFSRKASPSLRFSQHRLHAKPARLPENVDGVVYVNDKCINCAACSQFAPRSFERRSNAHVVHHQPIGDDEINEARAALAACPVAAIRVENKAERLHQSHDREATEQAWTKEDEYLVKEMALSPRLNGRPKPFPMKFHGLDHAYWVGHHNERSFGGVPYLVQAMHQGTKVWILVDSPRFDKSAVAAVTSITGPAGPDYLFLSHVDDTADHERWRDEFGLQQIFHAGDLGKHNWLNDKSLEQVEILLPDIDPTPGKLTAYSLDGDVLPNGELPEGSDVCLLHTPGHSPGSICLFQPRTATRPGLLFTGDTLGYTTRDGGRMSSFSRYGNRAKLQYETLERLFHLNFDLVAPGHGHSRDFRGMSEAAKQAELAEALDELLAKRRW